jgi:flagellar motor protein MotB
MKNVRGLASPAINTNVDFWPGMIDMLTSILMIFLLIYFVQYYLRNDNLEAAIAEQRRDIFRGSFEQQFSGDKDVSIRPELHSLRVTFGEGVLFEPAKSELQPRGKKALAKLAQVFNTTRAAISDQRPYKEIQIAGHTDQDNLNSPNYPHDNWELSTARALEVLKFLARQVTPPLDEKLMSASGFANNLPVPGDKTKSRRIEILILFTGEEAPVIGVGK